MTDSTPHRVLSDYDMFTVRFNIRMRTRVLYSAVVNIVGGSSASEPEIYRAAEEAARSWGAFCDPQSPNDVDHHFYDREFEPVSIERVAQVDGVMKDCAQFLANSDPKQAWD